MAYSRQEKCRICGGELNVVFDMGMIYPSAFLAEGDTPPEPAPLTLVKCAGCELIQLGHTVDLDSMYRKYYYQSGINASMQAALKNIVDEALKLVELSAGDVVVDIACNDMTLLAQYPDTLFRVGFDPAENLPKKIEPDWFTNDYFSALKYPAIPQAKIVTSIAMFYDLPSPPTFVRDVREILDSGGVWILQLNDLKSMLELNALDTVCHEHLEYYSIIDIMNLMTRSGLEIFRIEHNDVNGGSLRFYIDWRGSRPIEPSVLKYVRKEYEYLENEQGTIEAFVGRIQQARSTIMRWLELEAAQGHAIYGLAASTKGNTLLQYFGIDNAQIQAIADANPVKYGRKTVGTNIPIISEAQALEEKPDAFLVLAWGFLPFFLTSLLGYLRSGGVLVVPLPEPRVYSYEQGTGQIISYSLAQVVSVWEAESGD